MKAKDTLLLIHTITQNPNLARRVWFWHVASHFIRMSYFNHQDSRCFSTMRWTRYLSYSGGGGSRFLSTTPRKYRKCLKLAIYLKYKTVLPKQIILRAS